VGPIKQKMGVDVEFWVDVSILIKADFRVRCVMV